MPRYIDADKLIETYDRLAKDEWNKKTSPPSWAEAFESIIADIDDQPTADLVPKSEIERLQAEKDALIKDYAECMKDYATEIFAEIDNIINDYKLSERNLQLIQHGEPSIDQRYAELKKKYTEGEK